MCKVHSNGCKVILSLVSLVQYAICLYNAVQEMISSSHAAYLFPIGFLREVAIVRKIAMKRILTLHEVAICFEFYSNKESMQYWFASSRQTIFTINCVPPASFDIGFIITDRYWLSCAIHMCMCIHRDDRF